MGEVRLDGGLSRGLVAAFVRQIKIDAIRTLARGIIAFAMRPSARSERGLPTTMVVILALAAGCSRKVDELGASKTERQATSPATTTASPPVIATASLGDAGPAARASVDASTGTSQRVVPCNAVEQLGAWTRAGNAAGAPAASQGGTVRDGTYTLRSWRFYGSDDSSPPRTARLTIVVHGGTYERVLDERDLGVTRESGTFTVQGQEWTQRATCSDEGGIEVLGQFSYTATPTSLTLVMSTGTEQVEGQPPRATFVEEFFTRR
jgi:hypothetical protein